MELHPSFKRRPRQWILCIISLIVVVGAVAVVAGAAALGHDTLRDEGVASVTLDLDPSVLVNAIKKDPSVLADVVQKVVNRDVTDDLQSVASDATSAIGTAATAAATAVASKAEDVADHAPTSVSQAIDQAEGAVADLADEVIQNSGRFIPVKASLGTWRFCVTFDDGHIDCLDLPPSLESMIPGPVAAVAFNVYPALKDTADAFEQLTILPRNLILASVILHGLMVPWFAYLELAEKFDDPRWRFKLFVAISVCGVLVSVILFAATFALLRGVQSAAENLDLSSVSIGGAAKCIMICVAAASLAAMLISVILVSKCFRNKLDGWHERRRRHEKASLGQHGMKQYGSYHEVGA